VVLPVALEDTKLEEARLATCTGSAPTSLARAANSSRWKARQMAEPMALQTLFRNLHAQDQLEY
jgi:hypothetical protein